MPVERIGGDAERAIASVLRQEAPFPFELIRGLRGAVGVARGTGVRNVVEPNRNPATRRNRAVSEASGEILAFIDDDATPIRGMAGDGRAPISMRIPTCSPSAVPIPRRPIRRRPS
jgi:hypothetical protein